MTRPDQQPHLIEETIHLISAQIGDTPVWPHIEWGYQLWTDAGRPIWDRMGLTVTPSTTPCG